MTRYFLLGAAFVALLLTLGFSSGVSASQNLVQTGYAESTYGVMDDMLTSAVIIRNQTQSPPASTYYQAPNADFPSVPTDAIAPTNKTAFTVATYTDSYGNPGITILDSVVHPPATLNGKPKYTAGGTPATAYCNNDCTMLVVDEHGGEMAH